MRQSVHTTAVNFAPPCHQSSCSSEAGVGQAHCNAPPQPSSLSHCSVAWPAMPPAHAACCCIPDDATRLHAPPPLDQAMQAMQAHHCEQHLMLAASVAHVDSLRTAARNHLQLCFHTPTLCCACRAATSTTRASCGRMRLALVHCWCSQSTGARCSHTPAAAAATCRFQHTLTSCLYDVFCRLFVVIHACCLSCMLSWHLW
jgi:hypothetical protein